MDNIMDKKREDVNRHVTDKIKRLTEALYRVTDLYSDKEPLKWTLREDAVFLYNNLMSITEHNTPGTNVLYNEILGSILKVTHLLDLASLGGFISGINFDILKREYFTLKTLVETERDIIFSNQQILIESEKEKVAISMPKNKVRTSISKGQSSIGHSKGHSIKMSDRKEKIKEFLIKEGEKTTKEITSIFSGIGEKSIQRDLSDLVKTGELKASGEKRWRVYYVE